MPPVEAGNTIAEFLTALYPQKFPKNTTLNVRAILPGRGHAKDDFYGSVPELLADQRLAAWNAEGRNIYFGVSLRRGCDGAKTGCEWVPGLWTDLDAKDFGGSKDAIVASLTERLPAELQPPLLVDSGGGYQAFWPFYEPYHLNGNGKDTQRIERILRGLQRLLGADASRTDVSSVMRLPGFVNTKPEYNGPVAHIIRCEPDRRFSVDAFEHLAATEESAAMKGEARDHLDWVDLARVFKERGLYIRQADTRKHYVRCPWIFEHSTKTNDTETAIWSPSYEGGPWGFKCQHGHCAERTVRDVFLLFKPGEQPPVASPRKNEPEEEGQRLETVLLSEHRTDVGNASRLIAAYGGRIRYANGIGWLIWTGTHWETDSRDGVIPLAVRTIRKLFKLAMGVSEPDQRAELVKFALGCESRYKLEAMTELAKTDPRIRVKPDALDCDPWLLNVKNGTLNLRTGRLRAHDRNDLITRVVPAPYNPDATCPVWMAFLHRITGGDQTLVDFLQRAVGYALTGSIKEHALFVLYGIGRNGKSTFLGAISGLLAGYAQSLPTETLMAKKYEGIPNDIARLKSVRFAAAVETKKGKQLDESRVKQLTGGDTLTGRFLHREYFDFFPSHKIFLGTNHKPVIKDTTASIWSRLKLVPFVVQIPPEERDPDLPEKLKAELPGILAWAVRGCLDWQQRGLAEPVVVQEATAAYRMEQDALAQFAQDHLLLKPELATEISALYTAYLAWAIKDEEVGGIPLDKRAFTRRLVADHGLTRVASVHGGGKRLKGVGLKPPQPSDPTSGYRGLPCFQLSREEAFLGKTGNPVARFQAQEENGLENQAFNRATEDKKGSPSQEQKSSTFRVAAPSEPPSPPWLDDPVDSVEVARIIAALSPQEKRLLRDMERGA